MANLLSSSYQANFFSKNAFVTFVLIAFVLCCYTFIDHFLFCDEAEEVYVINEIFKGRILYKDTLVIYGPLLYIPFLICGFLTDDGITLIHLTRFGIILCQVLLLYFSAKKIKEHISNFAGNGFIALYATYIVFWVLPQSGYEFLYQNIAGLFCAYVMINYLVTSLITSSTKSKFDMCVIAITMIAPVFIANIHFLFSFCFCLLYLGEFFKSKQITSFLIICTTTCVLLIAICYPFIDFKGYIFYHFIAVKETFGSDLSLIGAMVKTVTTIPWFMFSCFIFIGLYIVSLLLKGSSFNLLFTKLVCILVIFTAICTLCFRCIYLWQGLPYLYVIGSIIILGISIITNKLSVVLKRVFLCIYVILLVTVVSLCFFKMDYIFKLPSSILKDGFIQLVEVGRIPKHTEFSDLVKILTKDDDQIIAWTFSSHEYLLANRLSATPTHHFLPVVSIYDFRNHPFMEMLDLKQETLLTISNNPPKIIQWDTSNIMQPSYTYPETKDFAYAKELVKYIEDNYVKIYNRNYFVRKDIFESFYGKVRLVNYPSFIFERDLIKYNKLVQKNISKAINIVGPLGKQEICKKISLTVDASFVQFMSATYTNDYSSSKSFLTLNIYNEKRLFSKKQISFKLLKDNSFFPVDLENLPMGKYDFCFTVDDNSIKNREPLTLYESAENQNFIYKFFDNGD